MRMTTNTFTVHFPTDEGQKHIVAASIAQTAATLWALTTNLTEDEAIKKAMSIYARVEEYLLKGDSA